MKILFAKKNIDKKLVSKKLPSEITCDFMEVISTKIIKKTAFDLKKKSLIFTSVKAVDAFFDNDFQPNENITSKKFNKIYCVGENTKKRLRHYGFGTFKMKKNAKKLAEFIVNKAPKEQFLHFGGNLTLNILNEKLSENEIDYQKITVYETQLLYPTYQYNYDAVVFFSPSGVKSFCKENPLEEKFAFSIGNTTTKALDKIKTKATFTSKKNNLKDLLTIINKEMIPTYDR